MTLSPFDPVCFGQYPKGEEPLVLHFQYESSGEDVFRYVLVDRIPITEIDPATRRRQGESTSGADIRDMYLKPKPEPKPEPEPVAKKKTANKRSK